MAVSAFKSSSRRTTQNPNSAGSGGRDPDKKPPPSRRSRSVSAYARRVQQQQPEAVAPEFLIKRDNPLFCSGDGFVRDEGFGDGTALKEGILGLGDDVRKINGGGGVGSGGRKGRSDGLGVGDGRRGRLASRGVVDGLDLTGSRKSVSRSFSMVDLDAVRRSRSVSRGYSVTSESEIELDSRSVAGSIKGIPNSKMGARAANSLDTFNAMGNLRTWTSQHPVMELQYDSATSLTCSRDDGASTGSFSGVEEKTIRAVSEQMKLEKVDDLIVNTTSGSIYETVQSEVRRAIADIQTDLSQERTRKLRADLAVEEYRVQELGRILKDILPEPRTSMQKTRPARKSSIERRRMSRRLTEEAMAYFDECVSLSTFDSSEFSSTDDPLLLFNGDTNPMSEPFSDERLRHHNEYLRAADCNADKHETSPCCSQSDNSNPSTGTKLSLSGAYSDLQQDIKKLLKRSPEVSAKDCKSIIGSSQKKGHYLVEEYSYLAANESSLAEALANKKQLESGSLLLCCDASFSPLGSFI